MANILFVHNNFPGQFAGIAARLDPARVHFLGAVPPRVLHAAFSVASAHVYLTYPFVLSWSLLEAMACGCLVLGSDTAPVREVVTHGENGLLLDFFDPAGLAEAMAAACANPDAFAAPRRNARLTIERHYDRARQCVPAWVSCVEDLC